MDSKGNLMKTSVEITTLALVEILRELNRDVKGLDLIRSEPVVSALHTLSYF